MIETLNNSLKIEELDSNKYYIMHLEMKDKNLNRFSEVAMQLQNTLRAKGLTKCIIAPMFDGKPELKPMEVEKFLVPMLVEMGYDLIKKPEPISRYQVKNLGKDCYVIADMEDGRGLFLRDGNNNLIKFTNKTEAYEYCYVLNAGESVHD